MDDKKPLCWIASSLEDLRKFPDEVKNVMGYALHLAQSGDRHLQAKPLKGFGGNSVLEVAEDHDGDTYRAVYTVRLANAVYVLHAFEKKSMTGIRTPKQHIDLIKNRLRIAQQDYAQRGKPQ